MTNADLMEIIGLLLEKNAAVEKMLALLR